MPSPVPNPSREIEKLWTRTWDMAASEGRRCDRIMPRRATTCLQAALFALDTRARHWLIAQRGTFAAAPDMKLAALASVGHRRPRRTDVAPPPHLPVVRWT